MRQTPKNDVFGEGYIELHARPQKQTFGAFRLDVRGFFAKSVALNPTYKMISQAVGHVALGRQDADSHSDSLTPPQVEHIC